MNSLDTLFLRNDSFITFEEILELAVEKDVDFILLGGNLFHDATPSQNTLNKCFKLLRQYTLGDRPISVEFLSDQSLAFHDALNQSVNYEDPNINVSIPVFSIHGYRDDPIGLENLSALNILATAGLINYFGRCTDLSQVEIKPILLKKGETQIALYGLSHISDPRLCRLLQAGKVIMEQPDESAGEWFNLMVIHQNRVDRGRKEYIPEEILPDFLDLIIWGHEHDCRIEAEVNTKKNFFVTQPGSSVVTSLKEGESLQKNVAILQIRKKQFQIQPLPLKTVRPFIFESITLSDFSEEYGLDQADAAEKVQNLAKEKMEEMIKRAEERLTNHPKQPKLPLIRLRIIYNDEAQMFNAIRFGQQYNERIANPADAVVFKKLVKKKKFEAMDCDKDAMSNAFNREEVESETKVEDVVDRYFDEVDEDKKLQVISPKVLSEMCFRMVEKNDANAADTILQIYQTMAVDHLMSELASENDIDNELKVFRDNQTENYEEIIKLFDKLGTTNKVSYEDGLHENLFKKRTPGSRKTKATDMMTDDDDESTPEPTTSRGRKQARGSGRGGRGRGRGARAMPQLDISMESETSARQPTLLDAMNQRKSSRTRSAPKVVYDISSDSE
ncbi:double-strand break repair protein MRE11-like isoform X2 [Episyrphus balteatus]|uniref:double-strand break repair protein MRE11-like isoform X2 n=1 Tax=Episyrphus balteatus TaxID=286459 RepID=UPI0024852A61|nr:double-strand break repair protein MRE11-like isoform X2 [Episyrphus balteatus]